MVLRLPRTERLSTGYYYFSIEKVYILYITIDIEEICGGDMLQCPKLRLRIFTYFVTLFFCSISCSLKSGPQIAPDYTNSPAVRKNTCPVAKNWIGLPFPGRTRVIWHTVWKRCGRYPYFPALNLFTSLKNQKPYFQLFVWKMVAAYWLLK